MAFIEKESKSKLFWFKILSSRTGKLEKGNGRRWALEQSIIREDVLRGKL